ncbi:MAG: FeoB-associated Cys-rich membrane protein [Lachnospiraceae bacterium]|nr:FeoB-associated Cys-rich membrane protein [Lachnospiraceae bacterium]
MGTIIVGGIVLALAGLAVYSIIRDKKNGKSCGGNCSNCGGHCK